MSRFHLKDICKSDEKIKRVLPGQHREAVFLEAYNDPFSKQLAYCRCHHFQNSVVVKDQV